MSGRLARERFAISCRPEQATIWQRRLAALFVVLALAGCAQGVTDQAQAPYPPYPPENTGNVPEHGGGDGSGGGSM